MPKTLPSATQSSPNRLRLAESSYETMNKGFERVFYSASRSDRVQVEGTVRSAAPSQKPVLHWSGNRYILNRLSIVNGLCKLKIIIIHKICACKKRFYCLTPQKYSACARIRGCFLREGRAPCGSLSKTCTSPVLDGLSLPMVQCGAARRTFPPKSRRPNVLSIDISDS